MNIAEIVKTTRKRKGLTMKQLADKAGVTAQTILNIEHEKHAPSLEELLAVMSAMDYEIVFKPRYKGGYYGE